MRIVLMGAPGVGKGTQAKRLAEKFNMAHLSSGDIFRAARSDGSQLGGKLAQYMDTGELVPDDIVVEVMVKAVTDVSDSGGLMLDGFPRTVAQAQALDEHLAEAEKSLDAVVIISAAKESIVRRIVGRRSCSGCGKIYHLEFMPPKKDNVCDDCGGQLIHRTDDNEQVVVQRLDAYNKQTEPVIGYYRSRGDIKIIDVDGDADADEVTAVMVAELESLDDEG